MIAVSYVASCQAVGILGLVFVAPFAALISYAYGLIPAFVTGVALALVSKRLRTKFLAAAAGGVIAAAPPFFFEGWIYRLESNMENLGLAPLWLGLCGAFSGWFSLQAYRAIVSPSDPESAR